MIEYPRRSHPTHRRIAFLLALQRLSGTTPERLWIFVYRRMIPLARFLKILINSKSKSCVYISAVNKWNPVNIENTGMRKNDAAMNDVFLLQPWE